MLLVQQCAFFLLCCAHASLAFSPGQNDVPFSLSSYQKARAEETSNYLDASRFHFQILFVDNDNFHGRIAEGMLARVAEYNDALFTLFPASATIQGGKAPVDSAAPPVALAACESLGLCSTRSSAFGTAFNLAYLDEYDLIVALDDDIQMRILRSLPAESGHEQKCRLLSEFLSIDFCGIQSQEEMTEQALQNMIDPELWDRVQPFYDLAKDSSSSIFASSAPTWEDLHQPRMVFTDSNAIVPNTKGWPLVEAALLVACAGVTRFCLDTMDAQFNVAFMKLLEQHFYRPEHLNCNVEQADEQLSRSSNHVTGFFSPKQRHARIEEHLEALRSKLENADDSD